MLKRIILLFSALTLGASATTLLEETFEGTWPGNWTVTNGTAITQSGVKYSGSQALELSEATVMHDLSGTNRSLWIRFHARISAAPQSLPEEPELSSSAAFYIGTNLNIMAYSNNVPVDLGIAMPTEAWTQFDMYCDYDRMAWNLSMNGTTIGAGLPLDSNGILPASIRITGTDPTPTYMDEIAILDHELASGAPDLDSDNLPDWWELRHFGDIQAANAGSPSDNSGMSLLETYIAGVEPSFYDPFVVAYDGTDLLNWQSMPGRTYHIQWAPSLFSNFTAIATVDWPVHDYPITTNATESAGFYRLNVSVQ